MLETTNIFDIGKDFKVLAIERIDNESKKYVSRSSARTNKNAASESILKRQSMKMKNIKHWRKKTNL